MRRAALLVLALLASGCERRLSAEEKAISDARDIARVEAVQDAAPPLVSLSPEPITFADIEKYRLFGASCSFLPEGARGRPVALAMANTAYLKIEGGLRIYAADKGGPELPLGNWTRYEGREHVIDLQIAAGATGNGQGTPSGEETTDWPGRLTIRDPYNRVVYSAAGTVQCGA